jgi:pimeloyl-ACP methyl ester carboxylesterase
MQARIEERVAEDPANVLEGFELSEADREALRQAEFQQIIRESTYERCAHGVGGWVDDELAFTKPWGFDVAQVSVPTLVRYGATDVLVPPAHGEWLAAHVPGCVVKIDGEAGHLASDPVAEIGQHIRWLRDGTPPEDTLS